MEAPAETPDRKRVLDLLMRGEIFEQILQQRYLGNKRFSIEGVEALLPLLTTTLDRAAELGAEQAVLAMSHRGRLAVMTHIVGKPPAEVFAGFEDVDPRSILGGGDVKYHLGATGEYVARGGKRINVHLNSNPSHLEAVDPVAMGRTRAKQDRLAAGGASQAAAARSSRSPCTATPPSPARGSSPRPSTWPRCRATAWAARCTSSSTT